MTKRRLEPVAEGYARKLANLRCTFGIRRERKNGRINKSFSNIRYKTAKKKLKICLLLYFAILITGIILTTAQSFTAVTYLWLGLVVLNIVCLVYAYNIKMNLSSLNLSEVISPVLFIIGILSIPFGMAFILPLWVLIDSRIIETTRVDK